MFKKFLLVNRSFMTIAASAKSVSVGLLILLFMFLGINCSNCMQRGGDIETGMGQPGPPSVPAEPAVLRPLSPVNRLLRKISEQIRVFKEGQSQEINPAVNEVIRDIDAYYDPYYKILDLSAARLSFQLRWKDLYFLFDHISAFCINNDVRTLDLIGNNLTSDGLPVLLILSMLKNKSLTMVRLEGNPICDGQNLDVFIREFTGRLNLKQAWKSALHLFINLGEERIDVDHAVRGERVPGDFLVLDFGPGIRQYKLKKCLENPTSSYLQRFTPFLVRACVWSLAGALVFLSSPYIENFFTSSEQCDPDIANQWLELCDFSNLTIG